MVKIFQELKRLGTKLVGKGPYNLAPFSYFCDRAQDESQFGMDHPESFTGILHQDTTGWVEFCAPTTFLTQVINPRLIGNQPRYIPFGIAPEPSRIIYSLSRGGIIGNTGMIYDTASRLAVAETTHNWTISPQYHPALLAPRLPAPEFFKGISLSLVTLSAEGFFHFLHELIPKVFFLNSLLHKVDHIFVNGKAHGWQQKWLEYAGVPIEKIIWMSGLSHYHCQQIIFSSNLVSDVQPNNWSIDAIKKTFNVKHSGKCDRWIWASRADANTRQLQWEQEILNHFPKFEPVCFSQLSPTEAINLCSNCQVFAGPHGAAFANLVFCPPQTSVIEFMPPNKDKPEYRRLAEVCDLKHATAVVDFETADNLDDLLKAIKYFVDTKVK